MNLREQNAKNLINKDPKVSQNAARAIVDRCDFKSFFELCENSAEIFDFIKEKIVNNLVSASRKENLKTTFEFAKCYSNDFEQVILRSWLKFANEDLTDEILELLENGSDDEKIYAAKYFQKINDSIALEGLNLGAKSQNEDLSCACAKALGAFEDNTLRDEFLEILNKGTDDFEKYRASLFLINYANKNDIEKIVANIHHSAFSANIASEILYNFNFDFTQNFEIKLKLLDEVVQAYPEDLPLETIYDFNLNEFLNLMLNNSKNSYCHRILVDFKRIIKLISTENIYTYDLQKQNVQDIKEISQKLDGFSPDLEIIKEELKSGNIHALRVLETLFEFNTPLENEILELINSTNDSAILCEGAKYAKQFGFLGKLDRQNLALRIQNENAKALFESYFS